MPCLFEETNAFFALNQSQIGIGRGEALPVPVLTPQLSFPPLQKKCLPLEETDDDELLFEIKKNFSVAMRNSRFYQGDQKLDRGLQRYSDKYSKALDGSFISNSENEWG
jgi:hypothetical protein